MANIRIDNGASVSRFYSDCESAELLAVFQYSMDAEAFTRAQIESDERRKFGAARYAVADLQSGTVRILSPKVEAAQ